MSSSLSKELNKRYNRLLHNAQKTPTLSNELNKRFSLMPKKHQEDLLNGSLTRNTGNL